MSWKRDPSLNTGHCVYHVHFLHRLWGTMNLVYMYSIILVYLGFTIISLLRYRIVTCIIWCSEGFKFKDLDKEYSLEFLPHF